VRVPSKAKHTLRVAIANVTVLKAFLHTIVLSTRSGSVRSARIVGFIILPTSASSLFPSTSRKWYYKPSIASEKNSAQDGIAVMIRAPRDVNLERAPLSDLVDADETIADVLD
jgi:hypothetical protein